MAVRLLNVEVSELCLGKPELRWVPSSAALSDALAALKKSGDTHISVWTCDHGNGTSSCVCVGKICMADVILFLCREQNQADPFKAFQTPVSEILPKGISPIVRHVEPNSSLLEAIDYMLDGTQNLVIPTQNQRTTSSRKVPANSQQLAFGCTKHNGRKYCWLTQEDVLRFLLNSIGAFSPIPTFTIESLNVVDSNIMTIHYNEPAFSMLDYFHRALNEHTSIAVVDGENRLIGEISPFTLACCDVTAAAAITALSAGDLMAYIDYGGPTEDLVQLMKRKLEEKNLGGMVELVDEFFHSSISSSSSSCSSDDESGSSRNSGSGRHFPGRSSEAIMCTPNSSLVAVLIQALAHRDSCVWVVEEDHTLVGSVSFAGILKVFRSFAGGRHSKNAV